MHLLCTNRRFKCIKCKSSYEHNHKRSLKLIKNVDGKKQDPGHYCFLETLVLKEPGRPEQICASQWGINSKIREKELTFFVVASCDLRHRKKKILDNGNRRYINNGIITYYKDSSDSEDNEGHLRISADS